MLAYYGVQIHLHSTRAVPVHFLSPSCHPHHTETYLLKLPSSLSGLHVLLPPLIRTRRLPAHAIDGVRNRVVDATARCLRRRLSRRARLGLDPIGGQRAGTRRRMAISRRRYCSAMRLILMLIFILLAKQERHLGCAWCATLGPVMAEVYRSRSMGARDSAQMKDCLMQRKLLSSRYETVMSRFHCSEGFWARVRSGREQSTTQRRAVRVGFSGEVLLPR